jgi:hypothetical protein
MKKQAETYPELTDPDDAASSVVDGRSTAAASAAGTPLASTAGSQKLKLTFNATGSNKDGAVTNGTVSDDE